MIIFYHQVTGNLSHFQIGALVNADSYGTDGYMIVDPGGMFPLPETGQAAFHLNEITDPILANQVTEAIYGETGRFYVDVDAIPPALMEVQ